MTDLELKNQAIGGIKTWVPHCQTCCYLIQRILVQKWQLQNIFQWYPPVQLLKCDTKAFPLIKNSFFNGFCVLEIESLFSPPCWWWFRRRNMLYFHLVEDTEECWADESTSTCIGYFLIDVTKLHARLQAQGDRWARKVNYFSFSYPYVYFKCSSLSVPEGGQLILHTFVSTQKNGCGVSGCSWQRCEEFCSQEEYQKE